MSYVGLVEVAQGGRSSFMVRTREYPWRFAALAHAKLLECLEVAGSPGTTATVRVVPPWRADVLDDQYVKWLEMKRSPPKKFSKDLDDHWLAKRRRAIAESGNSTVV